MKRYTLELDSFEVGCLAGLLMRTRGRDADFPQDDPVVIHLRHRLADVAKKIYEDDKIARAEATTPDVAT